jgi:glycosyltransferase involved in cell wall biosynthesis
MHVAVDGRELAGRRTGVGRYLAQLLAQWQQLPAAARHRFTLYAHAPVQVPAGPLHLRVVELAGAGGTRWEQATLAAALRRSPADVLFAPAYTAPLLTRTPTVLALHDVSFAAHPEWFGWRDGLRRRLVARASARRAARVLTLSDFSQREITRLFGVTAARIRVIPLGLGVLDDAAVTTTMEAPREPLILYVGSIFNRRHLPALIRALPLVRVQVPDATLAIVGENRTWPHQDLAAEAAAAGVGGAVELASFVDDDRLRALYRRASVFVFLSAYEGMGLTPLEALAHGVPPVVLDTPVAREVYGDAARFISTPDAAALAPRLVSLLCDEEERRALLAQAPAVLQRYRWADAAAATLAALEEAARS